jgi:hypothetical protein
VTIRSSIPAVTTAALSAISSAIAGQVTQFGQPVEVADGELGTYIADEFVQLIGVTGGRQTWAALGKQRRNEEYQLNGMIRCYVGNDDQAYVRQRCCDLFALIETALDNDPSLSGAVNGAVQAEANDMRWGVTDSGGRAAELDFTLSVVTQLIAT